MNHDPDSNRSRKDVKVCHGFRKFFTNQCINSELLTERRSLLEGHNLRANDNNYVRQQDNLYSEYLKAADNLTINEENRLKKKVVVLQQRNDNLDRLLDRLDKLEKEIGIKI